jgi:hypothetical protein
MIPPQLTGTKMSPRANCLLVGVVATRVDSLWGACMIFHRPRIGHFLRFPLSESREWVDYWLCVPRLSVFCDHAYLWLPTRDPCRPRRRT